ncbi:MAG: hypothetical protein IIY19_06990 [Lachnospiraceae bacterium]|nr:hypothetical protein [Lachnospiraceae bacterium]
MTDKEKMTALLNMGFTTEEAIALTKGNYRTVPDNRQPEPQQDPQPEPQPEPQQDPQPDPQPDDLKSYMQEFGRSLADTISKTLIQNNIATNQQPPQQSTEDILSLMLEPNAPETGGRTNGSK